ncbi:uncharacterized protein LOC127288342, partial [Leptopilina boulardi]|uniref:uncharacterized protein LOC127288342 n=1 Tax=Leptopilina boulardi TaxID=63433 RepID=UPI0021F647CC
KPIFFISRFFGVSPYTITSTKISISNAGVIYSGILLIYYIYIIELSASKGLDVINVNESSNLHDIWSLHNQLSSSVNDLNTLYSIQLFLWVFSISFNTISRIYIFFTTTLVTSIYWNLREICLERLLIGHYFLNYSFNFKAAFGFFVVDIQLLLSIAGSITTYLVILIGPTSLSN